MNPADQYNSQSRSLSATTNPAQYSHQQYSQYPPMSSTQAQYTLSSYPAQTYTQSSANPQMAYAPQSDMAQMPASYSMGSNTSYPGASGKLLSKLRKRNMH